MLRTAIESTGDQPINVGEPSRFEPADLCMLWPWLETYPEWVETAGVGLQWMFGNADRRWNEADTKTRIIYPILTELLGFPVLELTQSPYPVARLMGSALFPDYYLPGECVIESKRIGVSLLSFSSDASSFRSPLDQGLTYLDAYPARSCIVTNGWDWYAFWRASGQIPGGACGDHYLGARFRLDEVIEAADRTCLGQFLSMFNATSLSDRANRAVQITGFTSHCIRRGLFSSNSKLYFADQSERPLRGRGSGFRSPADGGRSGSA